jgi:hypothetical protein
MSKLISPIFRGQTAAGNTQLLRVNGNLLTNANTIAELDDVSLSGLALNQTLIYNSSVSKFTNQSLFFGSSLDDVVITTPQEDQKLIFDSATTKWINTTPKFFNININGKFKDSYLQNSTSTNYINLLVNNPLIFDSYNITGTNNNGISIDVNNFLSGFRTTCNYMFIYSMNLSIITVNNNSTLDFGFRTSINSNFLVASQFNRLDNKFQSLYVSSVQAVGSYFLYPYFNLFLTGGTNYAGQVNQDFSLSITIYEI